MSETRWNRDIFDRTTDGLALVRDLDWSYTANLVRPVYDPWAGTSREYVWTDDAACNDADPNLFQVSQLGDPDVPEDTEGLGMQRFLGEFNRRKVEQAKKICEGCPVRATCLKLADDSDRHWSVRGGLTPTRLTRGKKIERIPTFPAEDYVE